jgi:hypothetical protein
MPFFHAFPAASISRTRFMAWGTSLFGLLLLTGCPQSPPQTPPQAQHPVAQDNDLHFDMRYYDSIEMTPRSPRTERELAIFIQLQRLKMTKPFRNKQGQIVPTPESPNDSVYTQIGGSKAAGFANQAEEIADIQRKIDSLKVLEHIPLTPH